MILQKTLIIPAITVYDQFQVPGLTQVIVKAQFPGQLTPCIPFFKAVVRGQ
jgi:hypothetical protein